MNKLVLFLVLFGTFSCSKYGSDCTISSSCDTQSYDTGDLKIRISQNGGEGVYLVLYEGYVENKDTVWSGMVYESLEVFEVNASRRYAAEVYYYSDNQTIVALDGAKLKQEYNKECNTKCYQYPSLTLDCRKK